MDIERLRLHYPTYRAALFDAFGNRRRVHMIARYERDSSGAWRETERFTTDAGDTFVITDKVSGSIIYFRCGDSLIPANMDFNSPTCHACEQIVGEVHILHAISNNEYIYTTDTPGDLFPCLHKQSYTDGTAFYCLLTNNGDFFPRHGNRDPHALAEQLRLDADHKKGRFPLHAETLLRCAAILDNEPDPIPDPRNNTVTLSYLVDANPLGKAKTKTFDFLDAAVSWAKRNVPTISAGWSVYSTPAPGQLPLTLYDYRRTV